MFCSLQACARRRSMLWVAAVVAAWGASPLAAQTVVQVEEDWELVLAEPDSANTAPQVTCTISPTGSLDGLYSTLEINHKTVPSFAPGGVHLQSWSGDHNIYSKSIENNSRLSTTGETVRWTTRMTLHDYVLKFSVVNGSSTTWGDFSSNGLYAWYGSSLTSLNGYSPTFSVENSGVGFSSNRVTSMTLKRVRYKLSNGDVVTDDTPRVVHTVQQQVE